MMNAQTQVFALLLLICVQYSLAMTAKHGKGSSETTPCHARCEHGICVSTCICNEGYTGETCSEEIAPPPETEKVCEEKPVWKIHSAESLSMNQFAGFDDCINKDPLTCSSCVGACKDTDDICQGVEFKRERNVVYCDRGSADRANWKQFPMSITVITKCGCKEKGGNNLMTAERRCALRKRVVNRGDDDRVICGMNCDNHAAYTMTYCGGTCDDNLACGVVKGSYKSIAVVYDCPGGKQVTITMSVPTACDCN